MRLQINPKLMQLQTQLTSTKTQVDRISRIEYSDEIVKVYFSKSLKIGDEEMDAIFDVSNPVTLGLAEVQDALNTIFAVAFQTRTTQLTLTPADATIVVPPDYKGFYNELITTQIFQIVRQQAGANSQASAAYTDFALALTNCIAGNQNEIALQVCLNNMLDVLTEGIELEELSILLEAYRIPVSVLP